jgi:hypothetical protein
MLGDLTLALCVLSRFVPVGGALVEIGLIPIAAVASRHRIRAALVGGLAALIVGFLIAGVDNGPDRRRLHSAGTLVGVFADLRRLTLDQIRNPWTGLSRTVGEIGLGGVARPGDTIYLLLPVIAIAGAALVLV